MTEYKKPRVFNQEFKRDAVRLVLDGGRGGPGGLPGTGTP